MLSILVSWARAGRQLEPTYNMHVDDNLYADVGPYLDRTICASVAALFDVLGAPTNPLVPSPLSNDKFEAWYNHQRKLVGRQFNSRTMTVGLLPYKKTQLIEALRSWSSKKSFDLLEIAQLLGTLENHTKYARWARCWYFALQNAVRRVLLARFAILKRRYDKKGRERTFSRQLPAQLRDRVHCLIECEKAQLIWSTCQRFGVDELILASVGHLLSYLESTEDPWEIPIGMVIPWSRDFNS